MRVGIIGASGYTGGELLRILLSHPEITVTQATSRDKFGEHVSRVHSNLRGMTDLRFDKPDLNETIKKCDFVFTSTPHGVSSKLVPQLLESGLRVIDLGADFRLKNPADYEKWYGWPHPAPYLLEKAVYGIPEFYRAQIKGADLVACPGCTALTSILALAPAVKSGLIESGRIVVDIKMGSSGAGGKATAATNFSERFGVIRPYKPVGHRHTAEVEQELRLLGGAEDMKVALSVHAVNVVRGILATAHGFLQSVDIDVKEVWKAYRAVYEKEPFVRLVRDRRGLYKYPDPKVLIGSNYCDVGFEVDPHAGRLVMLAALDNLVKGAAGVAVQNMNIMMGVEERAGLHFPGLHPA